ncbi:anti-sigma regulatory factor [Streptomyces griseofuscus]|uniref:anti-sigma regulatory factor n=1 Tax=Streptomyces TaxID=1883 RepID=UPI00081F00D6|nr:anti-sigma regulatory factor [Streptomyces sp. LamerLS-31b]MBJ6998646.1 anti-sigma regulatory factor [Streptomyces sp. CRPSP2-6A1]MYQ94412.1 anti-sigma regulatory factor [Streptomyces sp. SID4946]SCF88791.1 serine/threonine-protein kinase RsbT [Streptomyces sp. DconLS]SCF90063.1 serine/threonine-protein kinase RsbT [Streptomyces sp. LamerLS-31b]
MAARDPAMTIRVPIRSDADLSWVRQQVRRRAAELAFGLVQQTKLVTAASELARNTLVYGGGGHMEITSLGHDGTDGLCLSFVDDGPGIRDVRLAMTDGYTTGDGLGLGLSGARRLVDEFTIDTEPGRGTAVTVITWAADLPVAERAVR